MRTIVTTFPRPHIRQPLAISLSLRMMLETLDYVKRNFGNNAMQKIENFTNSMRQRLNDMEDETTGNKLHPYEVAALANLMQVSPPTNEQRVRLSLKPQLPPELTVSDRALDLAD